MFFTKSTLTTFWGTHQKLKLDLKNNQNKTLIINGKNDVTVTVLYNDKTFDKGETGQGWVEWQAFLAQVKLITSDKIRCWCQ